MEAFAKHEQHLEDIEQLKSQQQYEAMQKAFEQRKDNKDEEVQVYQHKANRAAGIAVVKAISKQTKKRKEQINLIERLTTSQTELSIMDYSICCSNERYKSSEIAFACLLNSLQVLFCNSPSNFGILELKAFFIATYYGVSSKQCLSEETERIKLLRGIILDAHIICFGCSLENIAKEWMLKLESAATALSSPSTAEKREQHVEGSINDVSNDSPHQESHHYRRKDDRTDTPISVQF